MSRTHTMFTEAFRLNRPILLPARLSSLMSLRRQRAQLAKLDEKALADVGLTHGEALSESNRPFWDVPANWRC